MATANDRRLKVRNAYRKFIGRNHYSNARRDYCVKPYRDGKYYSDCSSSVSYAYREAGEGFGILNTVGMWNSKKLVDVPVIIKNGVIQNPEVLRIGDMLLFAGNDVGRKYAGYVGHVEMVGEIAGTTVQLYGHGSGLAKKHEMNGYCRTRYNTKSVTPLKRRLLIRVRRMIQDDATGGGDDTSSGAVAPLTGAYRPGLAENSPLDCLSGRSGPPQGEGKSGRACVVVTGKVYVRRGPSTAYGVMGVLEAGERLPSFGYTSPEGWHLVEYEGATGWVSGRYARREEKEDV